MENEHTFQNAINAISKISLAELIGSKNTDIKRRNEAQIRDASTKRLIEVRWTCSDGATSTSARVHDIRST